MNKKIIYIEETIYYLSEKIQILKSRRKYYE